MSAKARSAALEALKKKKWQLIAEVALGYCADELGEAQFLVSRQATVTGRRLWHGEAPQSIFMPKVFVKYRFFQAQRASLKSIL